MNSPNIYYFENPQNLNPYNYVNDNPLKYKDPSGKDLIEALIFGMVAGNVEAFFNHVQNASGNSTGLSDRDAYVQGYGGGFGFGFTNNQFGAAGGIGAASFVNDIRNGRKFNAEGAFKGAGTALALGTFFDLAPAPLNLFPGSAGSAIDPFTQFYQSEVVSTFVQAQGQMLQNISNSRTSNGGTGSGNINQLGNAVVSYANSTGADLSSPSFVAAIKAINLYNSPWLTSQSTSNSTPSVQATHYSVWMVTRT